MIMEMAQDECTETPSVSLVPRIATFVLSLAAGVVTFGGLTVEYMNNFAYLSDGANTSLPTWNTAGILGSAIGGAGIALVGSVPIRMGMNWAYRVFKGRPSPL